MIENFINRILRQIGIQVSRINTLERQIKKGEFKWLQEFGIKTVLDIGANVGFFSLMINKILPDASIYSFEPLKDCYQSLVKNTKNIKRIECFNIAIGSQTGETIIHRNEFSPSSSMLKMSQLHKDVFPDTKIESNEKIQVTSLDSLHNKISWNRNILLKIDVQGFEINVLEGATSSLNNIDVIIIETLFVELYENQTQFNDIYSFLVKHNFSYHGNLEQIKDPKSGHILWADSIFIKN